MTRLPLLPIRRLALAGLAALALGGLPTLDAQTAPDPRLTLQRIFGSAEFRGQRPPALRWWDDSTYTVLEPAGRGVELAAYHAGTGARRVLVSAAQLTPAGATEPLPIEDYSWSADHRRLLLFTNSARVWRANTRGDFWVLDLAAGTLRQLGAGAPPQVLQFAKFSPDGDRVAYVRENDLYVEPVAGGPAIRLTSDGSRTLLNGTFDWVHEEELFLRDGFRWSPDGTRIAYWQVDVSGVRDFLLINDTDSLYSFTIPVQYPKAGTTNAATRIGVVDAAGGPTTWLQVPGDPRNNYLARMDWAASTSELLVQQLDRRQQRRTFWVGTAATGAVRELFVERDSAWIDIWDDHQAWGPGPSVHWFPDGKAFLVLSEMDGWRHIWAIARDGARRLVTPGAYDVMKVLRIDMRRGWVYFQTALPEDAIHRQLWRARLDGRGAPERVTPAGGGWHDYDISPGATYAVHTASSAGVPPVVELVSLPDHRVRRTLVDNAALRDRLAAMRLPRPEFIRIPVGDGIVLDGSLLKPPGFDPAKRYPVLFYVYGEPWGTTVTDQYGGAQALWHAMLAQQGYIVASVDQRGTPVPRGRAWRKAVRGQLGGLRVREQAEAARVIGRMPGVDSTRMGVWGWSGGGSSTLLLMFRAPEVYKVGMSVAPVPDVHLYDTIYQERYVGLPDTDEPAYRDASAINFVEGLRGDLLVVHGTGDDNVHYQGTERLINALVAAGKPFQMMAYPNRTHGIYEGPGTTLHLYSLLTRYLQEHLPAGPR